MRRVCIIQARMSSTRLPGKILMDITGKPMLYHIIDRVRQCKKVDEIVIATTVGRIDYKVIELCKKINCSYFAGSQHDVLDRYYKAALEFKADIIIRVTGDCPLVDYRQIDEMIELQSKTNADCVENIDVGLPLGTGAEVFTLNAVENSWKNGKEQYQREHVDEYIYDNPSKFRIVRLQLQGHLKRTYRLTVDTLEDLTLIRRIYEHLYKNTPIDLKDAIQFLDKNKELLEINKRIKQRKSK